MTDVALRQRDVPMSSQKIDPDQLHHLLWGLTQDLSEFLRLFTSILHKCQKLVIILYEQQSQIQCSEAENSYLTRINSDMTDKISELECQVNPFSQDGDAICNSRFIE